ncbi:MAG: glycosyltransferase family 4 protein [Thaumarchaeota archaeon]|nr:glycosyltransferase family 4 protein [Nitrososphaerota archaeon]
MQGRPPRKICYIAPDVPIPYPSGASVHVAEVAASLSKLGHEVHVIARRTRSEEPKEENVSGFTVHRVYRQVVRAGRMRNSSGDGKEPGRRLGGAYYLYLHTLFALYVAVVASRVISRYHLEAIIERETAFGAGGMASVFSGRPMVLEIIGPRYSRLSVRRSRRILYYTETMLRSWVDRQKCTMVTAGVNLDLFRDDPPLGLSRRHALHLGDDMTVVGYVGTFQVWHGVDLLLQAGSALQTRHPRLRFLLVGPSYGRYETLAADLNLASICTFTGAVPYSETPSYMNACEVLVAPYNPSGDELRQKYGIGFPLKILEYMACGKPVVASDVPPIDALVTSKELGLLVPPGDAAALSSALEELIDDSDESSRIGQRGKALVESRYSWSRFAEVVSSCVQSI